MSNTCSLISISLLSSMSAKDSRFFCPSILRKWTSQKPLRLVSIRTSGSIMAAPIMYSTIRVSTVSRIRQMGQPSFGSNTSLTGMVQISSLMDVSRPMDKFVCCITLQLYHKAAIITVTNL